MTFRLFLKTWAQGFGTGLMCGTFLGALAVVIALRFMWPNMVVIPSMPVGAKVWRG